MQCRATLAFTLCLRYNCALTAVADIDSSAGLLLISDKAAVACSCWHAVLYSITLSSVHVTAVLHMVSV